MPVKPGQYNIDYFSGSQVSLYIGDVWVDEVTSISYSVEQSKRPLYGYSDQLFRAVAEGRVLVQGAFTINFKEAGYLWLILDRYQKMINQTNGALDPSLGDNTFSRNNIEQKKDIEEVVKMNLTNHEINEVYKQLAGINAEDKNNNLGILNAATSAQLGQASITGTAGKAEQTFEAFEDLVWGKKANRNIDEEDHRRTDDARLNPFDIYLTYGDFQDGNKQNHTIRMISQVNLIGAAQQIVIDGQPIQESYSFIARNVV